MKKIQTLLSTSLLLLFLSGAFLTADAYAGYEKTIHIEGNNNVEVTYVKDEVPHVPQSTYYNNYCNTIDYCNIYSPYYNPYTCNNRYTYIRVGIPVRHTYWGHRPKPPLPPRPHYPHKPQKPPFGDHHHKHIGRPLNHR